MEVVFGIIAGIITSLGMGGGAILILLLTLFMNLDQHISQATNLIFFIPTAITSIIINVKNKQIDFKTAKDIIIYGIVGAIVGSLIAVDLPNQKLRKIFGIFLLIIAIFQVYEIYTSYIKAKKTDNKNSEENKIKNRRAKKWNL